ncbi:MAG: putative alpha/beta hydrolase fold protein [Deltaproteobacteria bacterium]|nr:putative alpha/beta hydrolase fold protein [Deltaproteobacteria bacterium]
MPLKCMTAVTRTVTNYVSKMRISGFLLVLLACGAHPRPTVEVTSESDTPFGAAANFKPVAFGVEVGGKPGARPVVLIPGLGCPGEVWTETVAHLGEDYETHTLTLSGFAGRPPIKEPLSAAVRRDLTRYIRSRRLKAPIIVGHSMGGFIAYWLAAAHPDLVGPVIVVDAGPALSGDLDDAQQLRARWKHASDEEFVAQTRAAFTAMTSVPRRMESVIAAVTRSDRRAIGDAIYEMVTTDLSKEVHEIEAPVLVIAADGGYQQRIREQIESIPDHTMVVVPKTRHFVMFDAPEAFYRAIDSFLAAHPGKPAR